MFTIQLDTLGLLRVGGISAVAAVDNHVFTAWRNNHKLMRVLASNSPTVSFNLHGR